MKNSKLIQNLILYSLLLHIFVACSKNKESDFYPVLNTNNVTNLKALSAVCGGNITNDGGADIISRGVCWSTKENPTISDNKTTDGSGVGSFTSTIIGLTENTTYYIRAYASNNLRTGYGRELSFKTPIAVLTGSGSWLIDTTNTIIRIVYSPLIANEYPETIKFLSKNINNFKKELRKPDKIKFNSPNICVFTYLNPSQVVQGTFERIGNARVKIVNSVFSTGIECVSDGIILQLDYNKDYMMNILFKYLTSQDNSKDIFIQLIETFYGAGSYTLE